MAFKLLALVSLVAAVSAGLIPVEHHEHHEPQLYHAAVPQPQHVIYQKPHDIHGHAHAHEVYPDDPHPKYNFAYDVQDAVSGDSKSQVESRDGDVVQGEYSLDDADGFRRTVKYTADSVNGFNAVVHREPLAHAHHKVIAAAPASPVQYHHAAPTAVLKAPVQYAAPAYAAPTYAAPAPTYVHHEHEPLHQQQHHEQELQHQHQAQHYATYETPAPATHDAHDYYHH
ncbi:hypothetical protein ACLKA7_010006 [Drosophila subpalustris]